jgi:hypothetical protein
MCGDTSYNYLDEITGLWGFEPQAIRLKAGCST